MSGGGEDVRESEREREREKRRKKTRRGEAMKKKLVLFEPILGWAIILIIYHYVFDLLQ